VEETKPILAKDYVKLRKVEDIKVTSTHVVWVEKSADPVERSYQSHINLLSRETREIKRFTYSKHKDFAPCLSPDGRMLTFLSTRNKKPQIYLMDLNGGEAQQITKFKDGVDAPLWSPDSKNIIFLSKVDLKDDAPEDVEELMTKFEHDRKKANKEEQDRLKSDPKIITKIQYRTGTEYLEEDKFTHVFNYNIETKETRRISDGAFDYTPGTWISNSEIVTLTKREIPADLSFKASLIKLDITSTGVGTELTTFSTAYFMIPPEAFPDGEILVEKKSEGNLAGQIKKWGLLKGNGETPIINESIDRSIEKIKWISKTEAVVSVLDKGKNDLRLYNSTTGEFTLLFDCPASIEFFDCTDTQEIFFIASDPLYPSAVWKWKAVKGFDLVSDPNGDFLSNKNILDPKEIWLENPEGVKYQGWFFDAGEKDGKKPPLLLSMHGGPHEMWSNAGSMWHEWQVFLSAGYSILAFNPIGSDGYGEKFSQVITSKWGVDDARDLLAAVDYVVDQGKVDPNRLYITGGSYGGYQTANIISRDHRFKAAVTQRGVFDLITFWAGTDIAQFSFWEWERHYKDWDKDYLWHLWEHSPVGRAKDIQTPLMIIHSECDFRVSISQAEELFAALRIQDKEAVLVRYPRDGHELSRSGEPLHVIDRLEKMLSWFEDHQ
jgi:dipeptidyl aminopeptidase/acylaminoacyl peptidase